MNKLFKYDLLFCIITGVIAGLIAHRILEYLGLKNLFGLSTWWLLAAVPILWIFGVLFGYMLAKTGPGWSQFSKFAVIGFTNASVDYGMLYLLIAYSGIASGFWYGVFKAVSFLVATSHSFFWNKFWVFSAGNSGDKLEAVKFFGVSIFSTVINVFSAVGAVYLLSHWFSIDQEVVAGLGAVVGSGVALIFNFLGFKMTVFRK